MQHTPQHYQKQQPDLLDLAARLAMRRAQAELALLEAVVADPSRAVPIARDEGISDASFQQGDLRKLWIVAEFCHRNPDVSFTAAARFSLRHFHLWDESQPSGNYGQMRWSSRTLAVLVGAVFFCPPLIRERARKLASIIHRQHEAADLLKQLNGMWEAA